MTKALTGTRTKAQTRRTGASDLGSMLDSPGRVISCGGQVRGMARCPDGTYDTYRQMRGNPTIAIARAAMFAPIKASAWTYEAKDGVPDDRVKFIQQQFERLRSRLIADALRSVEYGWQPFERVYNIAAMGRLGYNRAKALMPDDTTAIVDKDTGQLIGIRNGDVTLYLDKAAVITYDAEGDDAYGRSIYENVREAAWWPWVNASGKLAQYMAKSAGVIPMVRYPMGRGKNANGAEVDNADNAAALLGSLSAGNGVAMPNQIDRAYEDLLRSGADVQSLAAWQISFLETRSGVGGEIIEAMRHYEKLMVRGMLQPERSILEGQSGTRADAGSHADLGLTMAIGLLSFVVGSVNALFVDPLLALNYGPDARGSVFIVPSPIRDDDREFIRNLMQAVLTANPDLLMAVADFDAMLDAVGVPKSAEVVDVATATGGQEIDVPGTVQKVMTEGTGDALADTALNGAQVQSMVQIVKEVAARQLPGDAAKGILRAAFPTMPQAVIDKIVNSVVLFRPAPTQPGPGVMASLARHIAYFRKLGIA